MGVGWAPIRAVGTVRDECRGVPGARGDPVMTGGRALERGTSWTPLFIQPMRPTLASPFHRPGWIYEEKYDGWRVLAYKQGATVRLRSRHGLDCTGRFRALAAAIASLPTAALILDGEVAVFDEHLRSRLDFLRRPAPHALVTPPMYIIFDCVYASGRDLRPYALGVRREVLETLIDGQHLLLAARRLPAHGVDAWAEVRDRLDEAVVSLERRDPERRHLRGVEPAERQHAPLVLFEGPGDVGL